MINRRLIVGLLVALTVLVGATSAVWVFKSGPATQPAPATALAPAPATSPPPPSLPSLPSPKSTPEPRPLDDFAAPQQLQVDTIGVDAPVLAMGTAADGSQEVPTTLTDTSWWRHGGRPGSPGNTVITGHAAHRPSQHGVFDELAHLQLGDRFHIHTGTGSAQYRVIKKLDVPRDKFARHAENIYRRSGPSGAVLMTCGSWDGHVWDSTIIVWASLVSVDEQ